MGDRPSPHELWQQANGDRDKYRRLMLEHGHLIPLKPGEKAEPLPCGWPARRVADDEVKAKVGFGRRNPHCSNCGDERGGPFGHEISECRYRSGMTAGDVAEILPEHRRSEFWEQAIERYLAEQWAADAPTPPAGATDSEVRGG